MYQNTFKPAQETMIMKTVGITGAAGYVGSRVCYELKKYYHIIPIDNFYKGTVRHIDGIDIIKADIRNRKRMEELLDVDCIIHLAAIPGVEPCEKARELSYDVNVNGTKVIAKICEKRQIPLIFATTFGVMGDPQQFPIKEDHPKNPMHWYGYTKYEGEKIIMEASKGNFPCYILIKSNICGIHAINGHIIFKPTVVNKFVDLVKKKNNILIYKPGTQARNFLPIKDAAHAYRLAVSRVTRASNNPEAFCIASPEAISIKDLAKKIVTISEKYDLSPKIKMVENPRTETLVKDFSVDISKAKKELGFSTEYSIDETVKEILETKNDF